VALEHRPRLIALDLDGTVIDEHNSVPPETRTALHACRDAGIELTFLTGRRPRTAGPLLDSIGLPAYVATNSGCLLWEYPAWRQLARRMFPVELVPELARLTDPYSVNFYLDSSQAGVEFVQLKRQSTPETELHLARYGGNTRVVHSAAELAGYEVTQVALPASPQIVLPLRDRVRAELDGRVLALAVRWPLLPTLALEVFGPQSHKGAALKYFAELLGVPQAACLAVGDDVNDVAMFKWAGYAVAMPHAQDEVRAAADEALKGNGARVLAAFLQRVAALPPAG
jgi:hypothetical protein